MIHWNTARVVKRERRTVDSAVRHFVTIEVETEDSECDALCHLDELVHPHPPAPEPTPAPPPAPSREPDAKPPRRGRAKASVDKD